MNKDLSCPSSAFPRCSYLGENNRGRLCFQQMRVRKRLCDSSADKRWPGRGASSCDGAPRQPPVPSRSVGAAPWTCPHCGMGMGDSPCVSVAVLQLTPGFHFAHWFILHVLSLRWVLPPHHPPAPLNPPSPQAALVQGWRIPNLNKAPVPPCGSRAGAGWAAGAPGCHLCRPWQMAA